MTDLPDVQIALPMDKIADFCRRWQITEFALFGSVLRDDFRPDSDIDVLVTFAPGIRYSLIPYLTMIEEVESILERNVDFLSKRVIEDSHNYVRRKSILQSAKTIYVA